jgi:hypothetical protein
MPITLNVPAPAARELVKEEARAILLTMAVDMVRERNGKAKLARRESQAMQAVRGMARGMLDARVTRLIAEEASAAKAATNVIRSARPDRLDSVGEKLGRTRGPGETDEDYRTALESLSDPEVQPWRAMLADAFEAALDAVLGAVGSPLEALIYRIALDLEDPNPRAPGVGG